MLQASNVQSDNKQSLTTCTLLQENTRESQGILLELKNKLETDYGLIIKELEKGIKNNPYEIALQLKLPLESYAYYLFKRKQPTALVDEFTEFLKANP